MSNGILGNFSVRNNLVVEEVLVNSATSSALTASGPTLVKIQVPQPILISPFLP